MKQKAQKTELRKWSDYGLSEESPTARAISELAKTVAERDARFQEEQMRFCILEAILSGDFMQHVGQDGKYAAVYKPYAQMQCAQRDALRTLDKLNKIRNILAE